eukprot:5413987-Alexandrium_andersonii.AAC.1
MTPIADATALSLEPGSVHRISQLVRGEPEEDCGVRLRERRLDEADRERVGVLHAHYGLSSVPGAHGRAPRV